MYENILALLHFKLSLVNFKLSKLIDSVEQTDIENVCLKYSDK